MIFLQPYKKYFDFSGRASRMEYWTFTLFYVIAYLVLSGLDMAAGTYSPVNQIGLFSTIFVLLSIIPSIAVAIRRLHDTDRIGWWFLLVFVPIIGSIWLIILQIFDSTPGDNRFGPNPKGVPAET